MSTEATAHGAMPNMLAAGQVNRMSALQECWEPNDGHTEHISEGSEAPACGHEGSVFEEGCHFLSYGEALRMVFLRHILLLVDEKE
eukprot:CAMPEP_0197728368 /NCGR_PEP_ID=MMETSP1434-20131217/26454_1 /TAXON_ID=265543 /ORGANISM="Minutocellus polymorphus, Strain CCMP3303" /LENGTH=85 /DNA_ID=CAMNT_0043314791 /DNA_START=38 /DNA_END=291 /DNA_ORIENTATION=+